MARKLEQLLMGFPEVTYASSRIGRAELGGDPEPVSNIEIYVGLKPMAEWITAPDRPGLQTAMERAMSAHPGLLFSFSQPIATRVVELLSGVKAQLAVKLFGPDLAVLAEKGGEIEALVKTVRGARDVPLALIGGVVALYVSGLYLSVPGSIGFIAVFGISMLNGVVLVNAINQNLEGGMALSTAVREGALSRLRPVLYSTFSRVQRAADSQGR